MGPFVWFQVILTLQVIFNVSAQLINEIRTDELSGLGTSASRLTSNSSIARRQVRCDDPSRIRCPNGNFCCLPGNICQPNNPRGGSSGWCCPNNLLQCNGLACCDPGSAICCGTTCCSTGSRCESGRCVVPPPTPDCIDSSQIRCPNANYCCPPGDVCQPNNPRGSRVCCPSDALQCGGRACCRPGVAICCGTTCCSIGSRCESGRCVAPPPTATSTSTTVLTTALTTASTSASTTASTTTSTTTITPTICPLGGRDLQDRQQADACPAPQQPGPKPPPTETRVPVATMTFNYEYLRTKQTKKRMSPAKQKLREDAVDQLFDSMCKGLNHIGHLNEAIFTFQNDPKKKDASRVAAGCGSHPCNTASSGKSCDEFPPASTTDGGAKAIYSCIAVLAQNIQGGVIGAFTRKHNMQADQHFKFEIIGYNCSTGKPTSSGGIRLLDPAFDGIHESPGVEGSPLVGSQRRDLSPGVTSIDDEPFPPLTPDDTNNTMIISIGDIQAGTYTLSTRLNNGSVSSLRVLDYLGFELARADVELDSNDENTLTFTLPTDGVGLGFFMDTQLDSLNISSSMQVGGQNVAPRRLMNTIVLGITLLSTTVIVQFMV